MPAVKDAPVKTPLDAKLLSPVDDRVIIEPLKRDNVTKGGIALPDNAAERQERGTVVATGPGRVIDGTGERFPMRIEVGDGVVFGPYAGQEIKIAGKTYNVLREPDVIAYVPGGWGQFDE